MLFVLGNINVVTSNELATRCTSDLKVVVAGIQQNSVNIVTNSLASPTVQFFGLPRDSTVPPNAPLFPKVADG